nr:G protein-coupled receptor [Proales similis]
MSLLLNEAVRISELNALAVSMGFYVTTIVLPVGVVLNLFSFYIFSRPSLNKTNMGFLYRWQSAVDIALLLLTIFVLGSEYVLSTRISDWSNFACGLVTFVRRFTVHASSWLTLVITVDRFLFVRFPTRLVNVRNNKATISIAIGAILALLALFNAPNFFYSLSQLNVSQGNRTVRIVLCTASSQLATATNLVSIALRTFIPFTVMITLDVLILLHVAKAKGRMRRGSARREHFFTLVVVAFNGVFVLFNAPLSISYLITTIQTALNIKLDPLQSTVFRFAQICAVYFAYTVQVFSFLIIAALNKLFRQQLLALVGHKQARLRILRDYRSSVYRP